jgi:hypothetical protein
MVIKTTNNLTEGATKTSLAYSEVAGTGVLRWKNPNGFSASWAVQVGETGQEQTEIVLLGASTPSGTAGTLTANSLYEHPVDTPLYAIKYDQVVFERSTSGTAGTATPITDGTINIQPDQEFTIFDDTSGTPTYAYKTMFRNSVLTVNSIESDWITSTGYSQYSLAKMRQRIKDKLWDASFVTDEQVNDWINEYQELMRNEAIQVNEDYALGTTSVAYGTAGTAAITATDFKQLRRVWVTTNGVDTYAATKMEANEFVPNQTFNETHPYFYMFGENIIGIAPSDSAGTASLTYYSLGTILANDTDELPVSMRGYTKGFVDYGLAMAYYKDNKNGEGKEREQSAKQVIETFKRQIAPRNKTGPTMIRLVDTVSGEDDTIL